MELLMTKQDVLEHNLQEVKQTLGNHEEANLQSLTLLLTDSKRLLALMEALSMAPLSSCREEQSHVSGKCEHDSGFGRGWTVIQHRFNGKENFYRGWANYRNGFGSIGGEFWIGLEHLHEMTTWREHELLVEIKDFDGNYGFAIYDLFRIGNEIDQYRMTSLGNYRGTAGDSLAVGQGEKFTTYDRDNDRYPGLNCATDRQGAWWYWKCSPSNLNGRYNNGRASMHWKDFRDDWRVLAYSRMMIREKDNKST